MPSPFPGMDPWLESRALFPDFHDGFLVYVREELNARLPAPFYSSLAGRVWVEPAGTQVVPDVQVTLGPGRIARGGGGTAVLEAPADVSLVEVESELDAEECRESVVEVYGEGGRLVASIELLSLANKFGEARGQYALKQRQLRAAGVHLLEIDLLRRGPHATLVPLGAMRRAAGPFDYHACLTRADRPGKHHVAPIRLAQPLPAVPVPLTPGVPDVTLELQPAFARTYDAALYSRRVDYTRPCDPTLDEAQAAWAAGVLTARGASA